MTPRYLADTSVLARLRKPAVAEAVHPILVDGAVAVSAVVQLEMQRYTRSPADHQRLAANLVGQPGCRRPRTCACALWTSSESWLPVASIAVSRCPTC